MKFKFPFLSRLLVIKETQLIIEDNKLRKLEEILDELKEINKNKIGVRII